MRATTRIGAALLGAALLIVGGVYWRASIVPSLEPGSGGDLALAPVKRISGPAVAWVIAPDDYGDDLPPIGSSLFDQRVAALGGVAALPYPFKALLDQLEGDARCADLPDGRCLVRALIPIGRSLQRLSAAPEFFRHPRVVAAMAGEPGGGPGPLQRDRLYLGHVGGSDIIEVISYNEAAARFEFQLVHDYGAGKTPRVVYASRALCLACHQNHAPLFSRPLWQETNANPLVAARLASYQEVFDGVPVRRGIDLPAAIDAATERANRFTLWQTLWQSGCGDVAAGTQTEALRCRAALFEAALQYRANGGHGYDATLREAIRPAFAASWNRRWPGGLAIPDADIPDRDPLPAEGAAIEDLTLAHIPAAFEPLAPRAPLEVWLRPDDVRIDETVAGLAAFLAIRDITDVESALIGKTAAILREVTLTCAPLADVRAPSFELNCGDAASGQFDGALSFARKAGYTGHATLTLAGERAQTGIQLRPMSSSRKRASRTFSGSYALQVSREGRAVRTAAGHAIDRITLTWPGPGQVGEVKITVREDSAAVGKAIAALAAQDSVGPLAASVFQRAPLMAALLGQLGATASTESLPSAVRPIAPPAHDEPQFPPAQVAGLFQRYCIPCHQTPTASPPNFLHGDEATVRARLVNCSKRIRYRLAMWQFSPEARGKTPMPPEQALRVLGADPATWPASAELAALKAYAAELDGGHDLNLPGNYESLAPCLAAPS